MPLFLANYESKSRKAVKAFWSGRDEARLKQATIGKSDQGERAAVTAGKNMNGFISLMEDLVRGNGLKTAEILLTRRVLTLPGFFRPTKLWDMIIIHRGTLVAALEFKSQVGPSFGNNCNNRAEEAIGTAHDFWTAYRERAFGDTPRPFLGWLMLRRHVHLFAISRPTFRCFRNFKTPPISTVTICSAKSSCTNSFTLPPRFWHLHVLLAETAASPATMT